MSLILRTSLATNAQQKRAMDAQWQQVQDLRMAGNATMEALLKMYGNAARTPAEAYREFDSTTKIEPRAAGEFATLTRLLQKPRSVSIGKSLFEYRKSSELDVGQSSMSGQIGVKLDHVDYGYGGVIVPIHDKGFGRQWRDVEAMRADGFDALVDDAREAEIVMMKTMDSYLWSGNSKLVVDGKKWLGLKGDSTVVSSTLSVDLAALASTPENIRAEVAEKRDELYITNKCVNPLRLAVSSEIMSNWERPFSGSDFGFGTILDMVKKLRGISDVYEESALTGNQIALYWDDLMGLHPVVGMGINTYAVPRQFHNSDFAFIKWCAVGFCAKVSKSGKKCALYAA